MDACVRCLFRQEPTTAEQRKAALRVDPPEQGKILSEAKPNIVTAAFIKIFQTGVGCYSSATGPLDFWDWAPLIVQSPGCCFRLVFGSAVV